MEELIKEPRYEVRISAILHLNTESGQDAKEYAEKLVDGLFHSHDISVWTTPYTYGVEQYKQKHTQENK